MLRNMMLIKINNKIGITNGVVKQTKTAITYRVHEIENEIMTNKIFYASTSELTIINNQTLLNKLINGRNKNNHKKR